MIISPDHLLMTPEGKYYWTKERVQEAWRLSTEAFQKALASGDHDRVVLLMGAPGSGKSTWLEKNKKPGVLFFDAVFKNFRSRQDYLRFAEQAGFYPEVVWVRTPLEVCLERNALRPEDRKVPEETLREMWESIEKCPPNPGQEGFRLTVVSGV
jgi:predicted kinase